MKKNSYPNSTILLIDDEPQILESCSFVLRTAGINNILTCIDSRNVKNILSEQEICVIVLDISMPNLSGMELLPQIINDYPDTPVIILSGANELETAVECMKAGAFDYIVKSEEESRFVTKVKRAIEIRELKQENFSLKRHLLSNSLEQPSAFSAIITENSNMKSIFQYIETIARTNRPVLITGETGVGKELIAKAIYIINGSKEDFVAVNVAGLDDTIFADTLFGHKKGAFTGADQTRKGLIEQAAGGTLFLDEVGDMEHSSQVKLLRLIQEREYYPLGSDVPKTTDARIIVATHCDIKKLLKEGKFRKDLYYRLRTHQVDILPLRDRLDDIPVLVNYFLETSAKTLNKKKPTPPRELLTLLSTYHFPGNVREMESLVFDAVSRHNGGTLSMEVFKKAISSERQGSKENPSSTDNNINESFSEFYNQNNNNGKFPTLKEAEHFLITEALKKSKHNQTIASQLLGITRSALNKRLNRAVEKN